MFNACGIQVWDFGNMQWMIDIYQDQIHSKNFALYVQPVSNGKLFAVILIKIIILPMNRDPDAVNPMINREPEIEPKTALLLFLRYFWYSLTS